MVPWLRLVFDHPDLQGSLTIAAKTLVIYAFLIAGLRLLGKRELGQMNPYDLVLIVVLGNAVQNAMMNNDNSLLGGLIAAATLLVINKIFTVVIQRSKRLEQWMVGHPVLIVSEGRVIASHMQREGITLEQLEQALREHGFCRAEEARMCVLEVDGSISVVPRHDGVLKTRPRFKGLRLS
jgi:uncharacterized membrane protein YcaP (DUF421 family)